MKAIFTVLLFLSFYVGQAQCIKGDCKKGQGTYVYEDKTKYEGAWKDGKTFGKGKITYPSGNVYEGFTLDGSKVGQGVYVFTNGSKYIGSFKNDNFNGIGDYTLMSGDRYIGNFVDGKMSGRGIYFVANGDIYEGLFKDNNRNGEGIFYFAKGGTHRGNWVNGEFIAGTTVKQKALYADSTLLQLTKSDAGLMMIPVKMNNSIVVDFVIGSGGTEVTLSPDVAYGLYRTNTLTDADVFMGGPFLDANGMLNEGVKFTIKEMQIGSVTIKNIPAGITKTGTEGSILGLNGLTKLGKVELDFRNNVLRQGR